MLCQNDFPFAVYEDANAAELEMKTKNAEEERLDKEQRHYRRIYYHIKTVKLYTALKLIPDNSQVLSEQMVSDLRAKLNETPWLHDGDAVEISIFNPATGECTNYPLTAIELDPRDPGVGIPTGTLYLCSSINLGTTS